MLPTSKACIGLVFAIPTFEPYLVVNAVTVCAKWGDVFVTTFPCLDASSNEIPPKSDVNTFVSTTSFVVASYPTKVAPPTEA